MTRPMPTEAGIVAFLQRCAAFYPDDAVDATMEEQRRFYNALCAEFSPPHPPELTTHDEHIAGEVPVRHYRPATLGTDVHLLYIHGGGFVVGGLHSHDSICAEIADAVGAELTAIDYRLAPEHVWPAQHMDCRVVFDRLVAEDKRLVLIGDSAGGNLAAGLAIAARDAGMGHAVVGQALIYPVLGGDLTRGSYVEMAEAPGLTTADVRYYREVIEAPEEDVVAHPLALPDVTGLPPTFITAAHFDPLRDDARAYAGRLANAGVNLTFREEPQMVHAWLRARHMSEGARAGFDALCQAIAQMAGVTRDARAPV